MAANKRAKKSKAKPAVKAKAKQAAKPVAKHATKTAVKSKAAPVVKAKPVKKPAANVKAAKSTGAKVAPFVTHKPMLARPGLSPIRPVVIPTAAKGPKPKALTAKNLAFYKDLLLKLRDRIIDEISFLANDNLNRSAKESSGDLSSHSFHMADQGTDNFDREFAASLLSSEQDVLYEIDEAIRRIDAGTYGICEVSGEPIERERLKVLPFARCSVIAQAEMERGKPRFRPFRRTSIQALEPQP
jgi:RNA polymerase-binding transcription factor DksA